MSAFLLELYVPLDSPVHRVDVRIKVVALAVFVLCVVALPRGEWLPLAVYTFLLAAAVGMSRMPPVSIAKRAGIVVPLVAGVSVVSTLFGGSAVLTASGEAASGVWVKSADFICRIALILVAGLLLAFTTPLWEVARGLRALGLPWLAVALFSFIVRYAFLLVEDIFIVHRALASRGGPPRGLRRKVRILAQASTSLLLRTYEHAEQVATAMEARGYDGEMHFVPRTPLSAGQAVSGIVSGAALLAILIWGWTR